MVLPSEFEARMRPLLGERYALMEAWMGEPMTAKGLRVNRLKIEPEAFAAVFEGTLTPSPFAADGFLTDAEHRAGSDPLHHAGAYYMQEPSAMSAVTVLAPTEGEHVLDLCAAPGGKSTQIAAAIGEWGLLWANEYVPARARILAQNIERCGVRSAIVSCEDTGRLAERLAGEFDAVLADVPCSGEGMFRKEPEAIPQWSVENIRLCAERSAEILDNAAVCVREGGRLVLSTCTFAPEENEWAVVRFLAAHPEFTLEPIDVPFGEAAFDAERIAAFGPPEDRAFAASVPLHYCRRIFPWNGGEGHFIALLRREGEGVVPFALSKDTADKTGAVEEAKALYEACFKTKPRGTFVRVGDTVRMLPVDFPDTQGLHIVSGGVAVAEVIEGRTRRLEPMHAVFMAASPKQCRRVVNLTKDDPRTAAFLRGEELRVTTSDGWAGVAVEGVMVGFGKAVGGRLKNRYPKGLRLPG